MEWKPIDEHYSAARRGEKSHSSKLKYLQVKKIRSLLSLGKLSQQKFADKFHVSRGCIQAIKEHKSWL